MRTFPMVLATGALLLVACGGDGGDSDESGGDSDRGGRPEANEEAASPDSSAATEAPSDSGGGSAGGGSAELPDDACSLLTADEVARVAPGATPAGDSVSAAGLSTASCNWDNPTHQLALTLNTGLPAAQMDASVETRTNDYDGTFVDVGGDRAGVWSVIPMNLSLHLRHGEILMSLDLNGDGANASQDELVALATAVVERLP